MFKKLFYRQSAVAAFSVLLLAVLTIAVPVMAAEQPYPPGAPPSFADLAAKVKDSVVNISTTQVVEGNPMKDFFGPNSPFGKFFGDQFSGKMPHGPMTTHALGSGFVISSDGLILTNNHVVEKATEIKVKLQDGKEYDAKIVGRDPKTDLALIRTKPGKDFPKPVVLGNSDAIRVGDWVMAVGNPFGLGETVTTGIISAKGRIIGAGPYDDFLQTDAAINPGNSGGPLFDMNGAVVGINTAIVAQGQGIGFAIPINLAKSLLPQLKAGKVIRGWLGIMIQDLTPELAKSFNIKETKGVLVANVAADSPAAKAGVQQGDVITSFNGKAVQSSRELSQMAAATAPNTQVKVDIIRGGTPKSIELTVGTMPEEGQAAVSQTEKTEWGMTVQQLTPELAQRLGFDSNAKGVVVSEVQPGSPADAANLRPGDLIVEANRHKVEDLQGYQQAIKGVKPGDNLLLLVQRDSGSFFVVLQSSKNQ
ncbi:MAG: DegQ family serine endoprotease [Desulfobacterales bacterium]